MKFDSKLQEEIVSFLTQRENFHFHGYAGTFFFRSWEKGNEKHLIESKRPHGNKDSISFMVNVYSLQYEQYAEYGVELSINMYLWGYQEECTVFEGWVENMDELKIILKAVGI